jgi:hypothetical protein
VTPFCDGHNAAGFRKLQKSGFSWLFLRLFVTFFFNFLWLFFTFWDGYNYSYYIAKTVTLWQLQMEPFVTILWLAKSGHKEDGYRKLQKSSLAVFCCDYLWLCLFLYFTSVLNTLTYIGCCRTNNYQKHICFWWSNITSLI